VLHRFEHLGVGVAADHVIELVGALQEHADPVVLPGAQVVQLEQRFHLAPPRVPGRIDEAGNLAVGIAGEIGEAAQRFGFFVEAVNWQHRKQLVDRPGVGGRAKHREVGVVSGGRQPFELLGDEAL